MSVRLSKAPRKLLFLGQFAGARLLLRCSLFHDIDQFVIKTVGLSQEIVIFLLDQRPYAFPSLLVQELARAVDIIPVPGAPKRNEGVINYRGKIVPVLNLRHCLGLTARSAEPADHFILLRLDERLFAIRVDRVLDITVVDAEKKREMLMGDSGTNVVHVQDGTVTVLNLGCLLSQLDETTGSAHSSVHREQ
jgi:purine-binding chemotaxis protein CheW